MNTDELGTGITGGEPVETPPSQNQTPPPPPVAPPPVYSAPPRRKIRWWIPITIGSVVLVFVIIPFFFVVAFMSAMKGGGGPAIGDRIALIHVDGVISGGSSEGGLFSEASAGSERIIGLLEKARKDDDVRAVVIRINSPGGSAAGSEEIYNEILLVKKDKPVYCSMGDVAASGGYYIAAGCDRVYANGATITGSIGVIMETTDLSGLFKKIGVAPQVVKSGKFKDIGSPNRPLTPDERQLIQSMIDDTYDQFVTAVSAGRKLPKPQVKEIANGRVFTGRQALKLKLVDDIGGLRDTILAAAKKVGIKGEPRVQKYDRHPGLFNLFDTESQEEQFRSKEYDLMLDRLIKRFASEGNSIESLR